MITLNQLLIPPSLLTGSGKITGLDVLAPGWGPVEYGGPVSNALWAGKMQIVEKSGSFYSNNRNVTASMVIARYRSGEFKKNLIFFFLLI